MKVFLFLALIVSFNSYAQSNHDHQDKSKGGNQHGEMHDGDHHGMGGMHGGMHGGHHKLDKTTLKQFFEPLPASIIDEKKNAALITLGKKLYSDTRLSVNDTISCNSCHQLNNFGVDG